MNINTNTIKEKPPNDGFSELRNNIEFKMDPRQQI